MVDFTNFNKRVLSVTFFWLALGFFLCGIGYVVYRVVTPLPASQVSVFGVVLRAAFAFALSVGCGLASRFLFLQSGDGLPRRAVVPEGHGVDASAGEVPVVEDSVAEPMAEPLAEPAEEVSESLPVSSGEMYASRKQRDLSPRDAKSQILQRVHKIMLQSYDDVALLNSAETEYESNDDAEPSSFVIQAAKDGGFSDSGLVEKLFARITKSIPKGTVLWSMQERLADDRLVFSKKRPFPKMLFPDVPSRVVTSSEEAVEAYQSKKFVVGQDSFGEKVEIDPKKSPHGLVIGGTGSGKSVFTLGLIEDLRSQGWQIVICDGKQTDYTSLINVPNVVAVGSKVEDWLRLAQFVEDQMTARYALSGERARKGLTPKFNQPPMLFLIDEFGSVRREVKSRYGKQGLDRFDSILKNIAAKARAAAIHMVIATQDIFASTFDGDLKANLSFIVSLGVAEARTLTDAFSTETRPKARRIGQSILEENKGRGIIEVGTDEGKTVVEFQTYFAYSPGGEFPDFEPAKSAWGEYKEKVSDHIPLMYPRVWYAEPEPDVLKAIDDVDEIGDLPMFPIQGKDGSILESKKMYDAVSDKYVARQVTSTTPLLGFMEDDDADSGGDPRTEALVDDGPEHWAEGLEAQEDVRVRPDFGLDD